MKRFSCFLGYDPRTGDYYLSETETKLEGFTCRLDGEERLRQLRRYRELAAVESLLRSERAA